MTGAMHVDRRFNSHVGIGSREQDFDGVECNSLIISHSSNGWNVDNGKACLLTITGGGAVAVVSRMLSTLFREKVGKTGRR